MNYRKRKHNSKILALALTASVSLTTFGCRQALDDYNSPSPNMTSEENAIKNTKESQQNTTKSEEKKTQEKEIYFGQWVIKEVLAYGQAGTYSKETAERLVGAVLDLSAEKASYFGEQPTDIEKVISTPVYKKQTISKDDFITTYRMTFDKLGMKSATVTGVTVADSQGNSFLFFIKDDNTLVVYGGDTYFKLIRK